MTSATLAQNHYRFRTDTGAVDATPTWGAAQDTPFFPGLETPFRIRFGLQNTGSGSGAGPHIVRISKNGAAYAAVTASSTGGVQSSQLASTVSNDGATIATANFRLTAGAGTAATGTYDADASAAPAIGAGTYTEYEFGLIIKSANVVAGDVLDFEIYNSTTAYTTYTNIPRIIIPEAAGSAFAADQLLGGNGSATANQASVLLTSTAAVAAGRLVVVVVGADNAGTTTGVDEGAVTSITDSVGGNTWIKAREYTNTPGSTAQDGTVCSIWYSVLTNALLVGSTITANFSNATARDATTISAKSFTVAAGNTVSVEATNATTGNYAVSVPPAINCTTSNRECLRIRATSGEYGTTIDNVPKHTSGWSPWIRGYGNSGSATTSQMNYVESTISTGTGASSGPISGGQGLGDEVDLYVAFRAVSVRVDSFRFRTDNNDVTVTPTWGAAEKVNFFPGLDTNFRLRFRVSSLGSGAGPHVLRLSKNGGAYAAITTSSTAGVKSANASSSADGDAISTANFRLSGGSGTATAGVYDEDGSAALSLASGTFTEFEYGLVIDSANVSANDVLDFEIYNGTAAYSDYVVIPRIIIPEAAGSDFTPGGLLMPRGSTSPNQTNISLSGVATAGQLVVIVVAVDNNQATDGDEGAVYLVDDSSTYNAYTKAVEFTNGQSAAQAGATVSIWYSRLAIDITSVTVYFSNTTSRDAAAITGKVWTIAAGKMPVLLGASTLANDAADPGSLNLTTINTECLRIRGTAMEYTGAVDITVAGSRTSGWSPFDRGVASTGVDATSMSVYAENIISVGTSAASDPTIAAADCASAYVAFRVVPVQAGVDFAEKAISQIGAAQHFDNFTPGHTSFAVSRIIGNGAVSGDLVVVAIATDNSTTTDAEDTNVISSVTDTVGNTYLKAASWQYGSVGVRNGSNISLWYSQITTGLAVGIGTNPITINFGTGAADRWSVAVTVAAFSVAAGKTVQVEAVNQTQGTVTTPAVLNATTANIECLRIRATSAEFDLDSQALGSVGWGQFLPSANNGSGVTLQSQLALAEFKISTGTSDSSTPTAVFSSAVDVASVYVAFRAVAAAGPPQTLTATNYTDTVESFGVPKLGVGLTQTKYTDTVESFGVPVVGRGVRTIVGVKYTDTVESFGVPVVGRGAVGLTGTKFTDPVESFGVPKISRTIVGVKYTDTVESFGVPVVGRGVRTIVGVKYSEAADSFGVPVITLGSPLAPVQYTTLGPGGYSIPRQRDLPPSVGGGDQTLTATKYTDTVESFGVPVVGRGVRIIVGVKYTDTVESFGVPVVGGGSGPVPVAAVTRLSPFGRPAAVLVPVVGGGIDIVKAIAEVVNVNETKTTFRALVQRIAETLNLGETLARASTLVRSVSEIINLNETRVTFRVLVQRAAETLNISETIARTSVLSRSVSETINLVETSVRSLAIDIIKVISETLNLNETRVTFRALVQRIAETLNVNETLARASVLVRVLSETLNINETRVTFRVLVQRIAETLNIGETLARASVFVRVIAETININETRLGSLSTDIVKVISETINLVETRVTKLASDIVKVVSEIVRSNETLTIFRPLVRLIAETVNVNETKTTFRALVQRIAETLNISETLARSSVIARPVSETVNVNETRVTFRALVQRVVETINLVETRLGVISTVALSLVQVISEIVRSTEAATTPTSPDHSLIVSYTPGSDRNDFTGEVGVRIGIGPADIPVRWIGYRCNTGNTGLRTVHLYEWFSDTVVATATIDLTGKTAGQYVWAAITPVTLLANGYYALLSNVTAFDGQQWTNPGAITMQSSIVNIYDSYRVPASGLSTGTPNDSFIGLDLGWNDPSGSIVTALGLNRLLNEVVRGVEALVRSSILIRPVSEIVNIVETVRTFRPLVRVISEVENLVEAVITYRPLVRVVAETMNLVETRVRSLATDITKVVAEVVNLTETRVFNISVQINKVIAEIVNSNEVRLASQVLTRLRSETINLSETIGFARVRAVIRDETLNLIETFSIRRFLVQLVAETSNKVEALVTARVMARVRTELVDVVEARVPARTIIQRISEALNLREALDHLTTIPSMVCAGLRLYAIFAAQAQIAPTVMIASTAIRPKLDGSAEIEPTVMASATLVPELDGSAKIATELEGRFIIEEC